MAKKLLVASQDKYNGYHTWRRCQICLSYSIYLLLSFPLPFVICFLWSLSLATLLVIPRILGTTTPLLLLVGLLAAVVMRVHSLRCHISDKLGSYSAIAKQIANFYILCTMNTTMGMAKLIMFMSIFVSTKILIFWQIAHNIHTMHSPGRLPRRMTSYWSKDFA